AGLLFGDYLPRGRLPWQLPRSLDQILRPGGTDVLADAMESWDLPYDLGATGAERADIRAKTDAGQPRPPRHGNPHSLYVACLSVACRTVVGVAVAHVARPYGPSWTVGSGHGCGLGRVAGLCRGRRAAGQRRGSVAVPGKAGHRLLGGERRSARLGGSGRQH